MIKKNPILTIIITILLSFIIFFHVFSNKKVINSYIDKKFFENDITNNIISLDEKIVTSQDEFNKTRFPLLASIPKENIYLYGIKPSGVVLYYKDKGFYYDWWYLTPRFILPKMNLSDYDRDGEDELAVVLYVGSGTSYAVEELHIIETSEDEVLSRDPNDENYFVLNPEYFKDYLFADYVEKIKNITDVNTYLKEDLLFIDIIIKEKTYTITLENNENAIEDKIILGDIVSFKLEDNKITIYLALGFMYEEYASPNYIGFIVADVNYENGKFSLNNYRFNMYEEIILK